MALADTSILHVAVSDDANGTLVVARRNKPLREAVNELDSRELAEAERVSHLLGH